MPRPSIQPTPVTLCSVGTSNPSLQISQEEALQFILTNFSLDDRTKILYSRILKNPSIQTRHIAANNLNDLLDSNLDHIQNRFEKEAVNLSSQSLKDALKKAKLKPSQVDFLITTTCTGTLCPGISSYLVETCGLKKSIRQADLVGMGCGAGLPALAQAWTYVCQNPASIAAVCSTEISSAAFLSNNDPGIVISNALFGDGSASIILRSIPRKKDKGSNRPAYPVLKDFSSQIKPEWRKDLWFDHQNGHLMNILAKDVPEKGAALIGEVIDGMLKKNGLLKSDIKHWVVHSGGEKVIQEIEKRFKLSGTELASSRAILKKFGNLSSASVFFVLKNELEANPLKSGEWGVMASFGAGFSASAILFQS